MYCKNCGKELVGNTEICIGCGYRSCNGDKFCSHCGKSVLPGQSLCINCGFMLDDYKNPIKETKEYKNVESKTKPIEYKKYTQEVRKTKILSLVLQVLSLITVLCLLFLPIYKYEFVPETFEEAIDILGDIETWEDLEQIVKNGGKIEKNFSLIDDIQIILSGITTEDEEPSTMLLNLSLGLMAVFEVIFGITLVCVAVPQIFQSAGELNDIDKTTLLLFNEIKKSGTSNKKENIFKKQTLYSMIMFALFDVIFASIEGNMIPDLSSVGIDIKIRHMVNFSGISSYAYVVITLFATYVVVSLLKNRKEKAILEQITKEEYEI